MGSTVWLVAVKWVVVVREEDDSGGGGVGGWVIDPQSRSFGASYRLGGEL